MLASAVVTPRRLLLSALLIVAGSAPAAAESLYVRAANTEVRASASPAGDLVAKLPIGTKVDVAEKGGAWVKISATVKGKAAAGWVFGAKLSKDKPDAEHFGGAGGGGATLAASEGDTAQAIRGLTPTAESFATRHAVSSADIAAVKKMEALSIPADELAEFMKDGKLGEYQP
jgi:uncharacterized protein YgiM (DUF1202 family)